MSRASSALGSLPISAHGKIRRRCSLGLSDCLLCDLGLGQADCVLVAVVLFAIVTIAYCIDACGERPLQ